MIDLHVHTTASDGRSTPEVLIRQVVHAGIRTFSVTDHDTVAALEETAALAGRAGLGFVAGIEITAVHDQRDVHMLGYFVDPESTSLRRFLEASRADRLRRALQMAELLEGLGVPIDIERVITRAGGTQSGKAIARPLVARALVEAGHVADISEAFERYLGEGRPAYVGRSGAPPVEVIARIREAGGIASLAHPATTQIDHLIPDLVEAGLAAIECYHSDHNGEATERYLATARQHGLAVTGGSDFHGEGMRHEEAFGQVALPASCFDELCARARVDWPAAPKAGAGRYSHE